MLKATGTKAATDKTISLLVKVLYLKRVLSFSDPKALVSKLIDNCWTLSIAPAKTGIILGSNALNP